MKNATINKIYLGYACFPPFVISDTLELTLKQPLSEDEVAERVRHNDFVSEDFEENFEELLSDLPTGYKYVYSVNRGDAAEWAHEEAMYGE